MAVPPFLGNYFPVLTNAANYGMMVSDGKETQTISNRPQNSEGSPKMTTNPYLLKWEDTTNWADTTHPLNNDYNTMTANLDSGLVAIISYDTNTHKSSLTVGNPATRKWHNSTDTQNWPALDREFGRKQWQAYIRDHEMESQAMIRERTPIAVTATIHLADYGEKFDFITFETEDGEQLEWIDENGATEQGVYVLASEDPEPYDKAAEKWLERLHGRYEVTEWA